MSIEQAHNTSESLDSQGTHLPDTQAIKPLQTTQNGIEAVNKPQHSITVVKALEHMRRSVGRPRSFQTPDDLEQAADEYFKVVPQEEWTITGVWLYIGTTRQTIMEYANGKPEYTDAIKRIRAMVENSYEVSLRVKGRPADMFALKQFGWRDNIDMTVQTEVNVNHTIDEKSMSMLTDWQAHLKSKTLQDNAIDADTV